MTRLMVMMGFLVAFGAGLTVGMRMQPTPPAVSGPTTRPTTRGSSWLVAELDLTSEQQEQMRQIWSETVGRGRRQVEEQRRQLRQERDRAIEELFGEELKPKYEQILRDYAQRNSELDRQWRSMYQEAVERTRQILTDEQRARYDQLRLHEPDRGGREDRPPRRDDRSNREQTRRGGDRATTLPEPIRESPSR